MTDNIHKELEKYDDGMFLVYVVSFFLLFTIVTVGCVAVGCDMGREIARYTRIMGMQPNTIALAEAICPAMNPPRLIQVELIPEQAGQQQESNHFDQIEELKSSKRQVLAATDFSAYRWKAFLRNQKRFPTAGSSR